MGLEQKLGLWDKVKNFKTIIYLTALTTLAVPTFSNCTIPEEEDNKPDTIVQLLKTDSNGEAKSTDPYTGEEFTVSVSDETTKKPIAGAEIIDLEQDCSKEKCFKGFIITAGKDYHPQAEIAAHHSDHPYTLTSNLAKVYSYTKYQTTGKERNSQSAESLMDWSINNWDYLGCRKKDQVASMIKGGTWIMREYAQIFSVGLLDQAVTKLSKAIEDGLDTGMAAHIWYFNPAKNGLPLSTGSLWTLDVRKMIAEVSGNKIDDDCDGQVDETDVFDPCVALAGETILFCDDFKGTSLDTGKWVYKGGNGSATVKDGVLELSVDYAKSYTMDSNFKKDIGTDTLVFETRWRLSSTSLDMFTEMSVTNNGFTMSYEQSKFVFGTATNSCRNTSTTILDITQYHTFKFEGKDGFDFYVDNGKVGTSSKCIPTGLSLPIHLTCQGTGNCVVDYIKLSKK